MRSSQSPSTVVGIDVSKAKLDVHLWPDGVDLSYDNTVPGIAKLIKRLRKHAVKLIVLEPTGRYERRAALALMEAGYEVESRNGTGKNLFISPSYEVARTRFNSEGD